MDFHHGTNARFRGLCPVTAALVVPEVIKIVIKIVSLAFQDHFDKGLTWFCSPKFSVKQWLMDVNGCFGIPTIESNGAWICSISSCPNPWLQVFFFFAWHGVRPEGVVRPTFMCFEEAKESERWRDS